MARKKYEFLNLGTVNRPYQKGMEEAVKRVLGSGRYVGGPEVEALEQSLKLLTGAPFAVGVSNGLDALRLILRGYMAMDVMKPGDEVIVPGNTYIATVLAISDAGLVPVLVDADAETSNMDTAKIEEAVTDATKAIMTVHLYGRICWDERMRRIALDYGLRVIEDNAQAIGARSACSGVYGGRVTGGLGDAAAFSFYPTKNVGALGDAGAVVTNDPELAAVVRALANYGSDRRYHNVFMGFNCRLDPIQAAILEYKMRFLERENEMRRKIARIYCDEIKNGQVRLPRLDGMSRELSEHVFHQFVVHVSDRLRFTEYLDKNGVGWDIHYATPPHMQPCYADSLGQRFAGRLPVTERLADECVSLPITGCTSETDAYEISAIINDFN